MAQYGRNQETEETNCQAPEGPVRCTQNCGFFGSAVTMGMCSKCYRDFVLSQSKTSSAKIAEALPTVHVTHEPAADRAQIQDSYLSSAQSEAAAATSGASASGQDPSRSRPNRCFSCKKRVGLTGFECRCGNLFCSAHRYSDKHSCTFDYKLAGRDSILKANPVVKADKIDKI